MGGSAQALIRWSGLCLLAAAGGAFAGCGATSESTRGPKGESHDADLRTYEEQFRPSDYDPEPETGTAGAHGGQHPDSVNVEIADATSPELVPGYRVQIYSSASIDEAKQKKDEAEGLFPTEWFYLVYDPPAYKLRAGNYQNRFEADRFVRQLVDHGFPDAWTVPDRVIKNPPPPPPRPSYGPDIPTDEKE